MALPKSHRRLQSADGTGCVHEGTGRGIRASEFCCDKNIQYLLNANCKVIGDFRCSRLFEIVGQKDNFILGG